jgi:hypothetical protein
MAKGVERRRSARLTIPPRFGLPGQESRQIRLVDLSLEGARIEHRHPLQTGLPCVVDLPAAIGGGSFLGRIVWSTLQRDEQTPEGDRPDSYQSGLTWAELTPEQFGVLAAALDLLTAAQKDEPMRALRLLAPASGGKPAWVRLYIQEIGEQWVAMIVGDDEPSPEPGHLKGIIFFGDSPEEAERFARAYLGEGVAQN